ncbi:MAG: hypothetical protein GX414_14480 [Acidobacteria bacterium]|nr:hypothetical protein [Acidobacteriota bacterium]
MPRRSPSNRRWLAPLGLIVIGLLSAAAATTPDGLEWALERLGYTPSAEDPYRAPVPDYTWPASLPATLQGMLSVAGGGLLVWGLLKLMTLGRRPPGGA